MTRRPIVSALAIAAALLSAAVAVKLARHFGYIDMEQGRRAIGAVIGLMVAYYGNFVPKQLGRSRGLASDRRKQTALRISGWSFTLTGLGYAAISLSWPEQPGSIVAMALMASAIIITLFFSIRSCLTRSPGGAEEDPSTNL